MRPFGAGITGFANATDATVANIDLLQNMPQPKGDVKEAFFPFFFLPFLALAALGPWGWW
jgi:hypothetical protein